MQSLRLGTRGSQLALVQAHTVARLLRERRGVASEVVVIKTSGDRLADAVLSEIGGKRLFVKEIEDALLAGEIDLAVHSSKDLPAELPDGLDLGAVLPREDARDAVVLPQGVGRLASIDDLSRRFDGAGRIGTSSVRRTTQLSRLFPGVQFLPVRGNLDTRLRKLDAGDQFDAIVLAAAGLRRLEQSNRISALLPVESCVPAPGQGTIAIEMRVDDDAVRRNLASIDDRPTAAALTAERAVVTTLGGGCQMPIGAYAVVEERTIAITAIVLSVDGSRAVRAETRGLAVDAHAVGVQAAEQLLSLGAGEILADVHRVQNGSERPA